MNAEKKPQTMKPETAAKKLGILLSSAPEDFQNSPISRTQFNELLESPPEWLVALKKDGPHPRQVVAGKLGVSIAGLSRGGATEPLTTAEITALLQSPPEWLVAERATQAEVRAVQRRTRERDAERRARAAE